MAIPHHHQRTDKLYLGSIQGEIGILSQRLRNFSPLHHDLFLVKASNHHQVKNRLRNYRFPRSWPDAWRQALSNVKTFLDSQRVSDDFLLSRFAWVDRLLEKSGVGLIDYLNHFEEEGELQVHALYLNLRIAHQLYLGGKQHY